MSLSILIAHNYYRERGGEDVVFETEAGLLEQHGHRVERLTFHNDEIPDRLSALGRVRLAGRTLWSPESRRQFRLLLSNPKPDIVHFHNTFPLISPSAHAACREAGVPVVQTLHNYRLLCPSATFFRNGRPCEDCLGRTAPWPAVLHACYRNSRSQTVVTAAMLTAHRLRGTWARGVDVYIALTEFSRRKFVEGGLPADKIALKPNFVHPDPGIGLHDGDFFLFVSRLDPNKGVETLLRAWQLLERPPPLLIPNDGPLTEAVRRAAELSPAIDYQGRVERNSMLALMHKARALILPSEWYESFPATIVEAFAHSLPVIASRLGAMPEIIEDGRTGLHFEPGDPADLATKVQWAWTHPEEMERMGREARREYETKYSAEQNYERLMQVYERAMAAAKEERA